MPKPSVLFEVAVQSAVQVLQPGDTVLLALNMGATAEHAARLLDRLAEVFPDVKFCVVDHVTGIVIQHGDAGQP